MRRLLLLSLCSVLGLLPQQLLAASLDDVLGKALFERQWVAAPASTDAADGLGPLFNAKSCVACHRGGGGAQLESNGILRGVVVRLTDGKGAPHPKFGRQLQDQAIAGHGAEGKVQWTGNTLTPRMNDGAALPPFEVRVSSSLRVSSMIEAVDEMAIAALADPADADGDGVSGRTRMLDGGAMGRFGLKSAHATLESQIADAFAFDLGLSSTHNPLPAGDCTTAQSTCMQAPSGESAALDGHEISDDMIGFVASYLRSLERRIPETANAGAAVFDLTGCTACHQSVMPDKKGGAVPLYSDLLLHDMGPASAGVVQDGDVAVTEWRTAPLVDLFVKGTARRYMHDGRAGSILDAITAHGGEAEQARKAYLSLTQKDKHELLQFLETL